MIFLIVYENSKIEYYENLGILKGFSTVLVFRVFSFISKIFEFFNSCKILNVN